MAVHLLDQGFSTPLERLVEDYLISCRARGLSPRTDEQYGYALRAVFLPWCASEGISQLDQLDRRAFDRFTSSLSTTAEPLRRTRVEILGALVHSAGPAPPELGHPRGGGGARSAAASPPGEAHPRRPHP